MQQQIEQNQQLDSFTQIIASQLPFEIYKSMQENNQIKYLQQTFQNIINQHKDILSEPLRVPATRLGDDVLYNEIQLLFVESFSFLYNNKAKNDFKDIPPNIEFGGQITQKQYEEKKQYIFNCLQLFIFPKDISGQFEQSKQKQAEDYERTNKEILHLRQLEIYKHGSIFKYCCFLIELFFDDIFAKFRTFSNLQFQIKFYTYFHIIHFEFNYYNDMIIDYFTKLNQKINQQQQRKFSDLFLEDNYSFQ